MRITRRSFVKSAGLAVGSAAVGPTLLVAGDTTLAAGRPYREPPTVRSENGVLDTRLRMAPSSVDIGPRVVRVETYEGGIPGPTLRVRAGDRLRILLENQMEPLGVPGAGAPPPGYLAEMEPPACLPPPPPWVDRHGPASLAQRQIFTNLHTHGLQVCPRDPGDNVLLIVRPGQRHQYEYHIPKDHPTGLHWYHPHFHTSTTHQAWQGLAGGLIVEGDLDEVPAVKAARPERVMVLNALWVGDGGEVPTATVVPNAGPSPFTSIPAVPTQMIFTINGVFQPEIRIRPGETQRWRILAAAPHRFFWLSVGGHVLHQIVQDGVPFAHARPMSRIMLATGNRAEIIVRGGEPGRYPIVAHAYDQGHPGGVRPTRLLGTLVCEGAPIKDRPLPGRLVDPPAMPGPVGKRRELVFSGDISGRTGPGVKFYIDGKIFDPCRLDQCVEVGTVEEWTLINQDVFQHPFHIHINPFQVVDIQGAPANDPSWTYDPSVWWDVFRLPPRGRVTLRMYFRPEYTGLTVYHCHILPHEDNGMMGSVCLSPGENSCGCSPQPWPNMGTIRNRGCIS